MYFVNFIKLRDKNDEILNFFTILYITAIAIVSEISLSVPVTNVGQ